MGTTTYSEKREAGKVIVNVIGNVLDPTSNLVLIIEPTVSASRDESHLNFDHGRVVAGETSELVGKFEAFVFDTANQKIVPIEEASNPEEKGIYVVLKNDNKEIPKGSYSNADEVIKKDEESEKTSSTLQYQLTHDSALQGNIYRGTVLSKLIAGTNPGTFTHKKGQIEIKVNGITK